MMKIRNASMADLEAITEMEKECFPEAEAATKESFRKRIAHFSTHFWLLEEEGRLIGMINGMVTEEAKLRDEMYEDAGLHDPNGSWQMIFGVETIPEYRCRGYAGKVMERVIRDCQAAGRKGIVLTCKDRLVPYYEKFGFVNEGISESVHGGVVWYDMRLVFSDNMG